MASFYKLTSSGSSLGPLVHGLGSSRGRSTGLTPLRFMDATHASITSIESVSLSELADRLGCPVETIYDLRSQGRGPRGFRVGRQLRFRVSEVEAWLTRLEQADAVRHPGEGA